MMYIEIHNANGDFDHVERLDEPMFVYWQKSNGVMSTCERGMAEGIIGKHDAVYLFGRLALPHDEPEPYALEITEGEYNERLAGAPDAEDDIVPEAPDEELPLSRAELTELVRELQQQNRILTESVLEMSQIVYGS